MANNFNMKIFLISIRVRFHLETYPYSCYVTKNGEYATGVNEDKASYFISRSVIKGVDDYWTIQELSEKKDRRRKLIPLLKKSKVIIKEKITEHQIQKHNYRTGKFKKK